MCDYISCENQEEKTFLVWFPIWGAKCGPNDYEKDSFSSNLCVDCARKALLERCGRDFAYITEDDTEFGKKIDISIVR